MAAAAETDGGGRRVEESGCGDRIDPVMRSVFGVGRKSPPEKFSGGGATVVAGSGGGGGWPDSLREKRELWLRRCSGCCGEGDGGRRGWQPAAETQTEEGGACGESGCEDRIDPVIRSVFGVGRKSLPEKFSGGGDVVAVVAGGWEGRPEIGERERSED
ncbi:hypothetical protein Tco_0214410 [Tanacetum coccineum]